MIRTVSSIHFHIIFWHFKYMFWLWQLNCEWSLSRRQTGTGFAFWQTMDRPGVRVFPFCRFQIYHQLEFFLFANFKSTVSLTIFIIPDFSKLLLDFVLDYQTGFAFWQTMDRPIFWSFPFFLQISNQPPVGVFPFSRFPKILDFELDR